MLDFVRQVASERVWAEALSWRGSVRLPYVNNIRVAATRALHALCLLVLATNSGRAATWRVELDGTGDYTSIQAAVLGAASLDTIQVGPGRYDTMFTYTPPQGGWTDEVIVAVEGKDITIIGSGDRGTVIGPAVAPPWSITGPIGIVTTQTGSITMSEIVIENMSIGIYHAASSIDACNIYVSNCRVGIATMGQGVSTIGGSGFNDCAWGVMATRDEGAHSLSIEVCAFAGRQPGVTGCHVLAQYLEYVEISGSTFSDGLTSVQVDRTSAHIEGCAILSGVWTHVIILGSDVLMTNNMLSGGGRQLYLGGGALLRGSGNVLSGTGSAWPGSATIEVSRSSIDFHGNDIYRDGSMDYVVRCGSGTDEPVNLVDNYWGPIWPGWHDQYIYDGNDTLTVGTVVEYAPYLEGSVPNETMSWGEVKSMFR